MFLPPAAASLDPTLTQHWQNERTLVSAFIINSVDYCNSGFNSSGAVRLRALQSVLNSSARIIVKKRKYYQITTTIRDELHWLPVQRRLDCKLWNIIHMCLHQSAPLYIMCINFRRDRRSTSSCALVVTIKKYWPYRVRSICLELAPVGG